MDMNLERQYCIDNMSETLWEAMTNCMNNDRDYDAIAIAQEWLIDGKDPEDGSYVFTFLDNFTLEIT